VAEKLRQGLLCPVSPFTVMNGKQRRNTEFQMFMHRTTAYRNTNIKILAKESLGYFQFKKYKPWFDEGCSKLLDQRKQAKLQWLQDPADISGIKRGNI
jgi:hypothetical protein